MQAGQLSPYQKWSILIGASLAIAWNVKSRAKVTMEAA